MIELVNIASEYIDQLIDDGKWLEAMVAIASESMGQWVFYGIMFLAIFAVLYIRNQSLIPLVIIGLLIFGLVRINIPPPLMSLVLVIMSIGVGALIYMLFVRERK